jgi:hypothetical protein
VIAFARYDTTRNFVSTPVFHIYTCSHRPVGPTIHQSIHELLHEHQVRAKDIFGATEDFGASVKQAFLTVAAEHICINSETISGVRNALIPTDAGVPYLWSEGQRWSLWVCLSYQIFRRQSEE